MPPDYFAADGQRWGNPHYRWDWHQAQDFAWWRARIATQAQRFDRLRIDHFRGLDAVWMIPADQPTAVSGAWQPVPGAALLGAITRAFPDLALVAENLGIITPHSGTLGAAMTALNKRVPAIAVSAEGSAADDAEIVAELVVKLVDALTTRSGRVRLPRGIGLNVNTPAIDAATQSADDFAFVLTRIGESANFGLQFFENLGDSPVARGFGIPADIHLPGVSLAIPASSAGYPVDDDPRSESNALAPLVVTLSPIEGTPAADSADEGRVRGSLRELLRRRH